MPTFLTGIGAKIIGLAIGAMIVVGLWLYAGMMKAQRDEMKAELSSAVQINKQNQAAFDAYKADEAKQIATIVADRDRALAMEAKIASRHKEINSASKSDDGPIAPVLRRALDGLRQSPDSH